MAVIPEESKQTDISLDRTTTDIYRKDTNTDQYVSFTMAVMNLGLVRSLGLEPCSIALLAFAITTLCYQKQISVIKTFLYWNGFPRSGASNLIKCFMCSDSGPRSSNN